MRVRKGAENYSIPPQTIFNSEIMACPCNLPNLCGPISVAKRMALQVARWLRIYLPMQETRVGSLDQEDPLEEEMATQSNILVWEIPWTEEPGGLQSMR